MFQFALLFVMDPDQADPVESAMPAVGYCIAAGGTIQDLVPPVVDDKRYPFTAGFPRAFSFVAS